MTFLERYQGEDTWYGKVLVMGVYHTVMCQRDKTWTLHDTAKEFECSIGLVSENLKLYKRIDTDTKLINCKSRVEALTKLG